MNWPKITGVICVLLFLPAPASGQETVPIDLGAAAQTVAMPGNVGETYRFILLNGIPGKPYEVRVEQRVIRPAVIEAPEIDLAGFASACSDVLKLAAGLKAKTSEADIKSAVKEIEAKLEAAACDPTTIATVGEAVGATVIPVQGSFVLRAGSELIVTISRGDKKWTLTVSAGERGVWLTTYGVGIVPNKNERVMLVQRAEKEFVVTDGGEEGGKVVIPTVLYHWLPTSRMLSNFALSLTGGLGISKERPAAFLGVGVAYNWNLLLFAGVGYAPHWERKLDYTPGRVLAENLTLDQLNEKQWRPSLMLGGSIRFGGNPFKTAK